MLTIDALTDLRRVRHAFFTRQGGVSEGIYASLNCGFGSGDDGGRVAENRARAMGLIALTSDRLVTAYQTHSTRVAVVEDVWWPEDAPEVDALVTTQPGLALGVLTADCAPVLLADAKADVVGAAHAGWRGALGGILEATVEAMESLGAKRRRVRAGIGPTIAQASYEVGPEFPAPFLALAPENADFFVPAERPGHYRFDLKAFVTRRLTAAGLGGVASLPCDTCADDALFFSYRRACLRGERDYGRGLSVICLER